MRITQSIILVLIAALVLSLPCYPQMMESSENQGFLNAPPVYLHNEQDFPLTGLGIYVPQRGETIPDVDLSSISSDAFNKNGDNVQPQLDLEYNWIRVGAIRGFGDGWAAGVTIPWYRNKVSGAIGGQPASGIAEGFGNIGLIGKKLLWQDQEGRRAVVAFGLELPTGKDNSIFSQNNYVTNGYWSGFPQRMPLGWEPSNGTFNGLLAASYGRLYQRLSYEALLAGKIYGTNDEDVKIGNILIAAITGTYGINRDLAGSLGFTLRSQADDDYPDAPNPALFQTALAGTTTHGTTLFMDFGVRYIVMKKVTVGFGLRTPIMDPDNGMVPRTQYSIIFYPNL